MNESFISTLKEDLFSAETERVRYALGAIYWIADLYVLGGDAETLHESEPYRDEIISTDISVEFTDEVKSLLREYILNNEGANIASAIGMLGKFADSNDSELFRNQLNVAFSNLLFANGALHQSLVSLCELSEISHGLRASLPEIDSNVALAREYLKKHGHDHTW